MQIYFKPGLWRWWCIFLCCLYAAGVAGYWLGMPGLALVIPASTGLLRQHQSAGVLCCDLSSVRLHDYWQLPGILCIHLEAGGPARVLRATPGSQVSVQQMARVLWLFADEVPATTWSAVHRWLKLQLPPQAVGLSMSK
ncbi:MAG: hypothetical protein AAF993_09075 [Pseudomonadota bacterium]